MEILNASSSLKTSSSTSSRSRRRRRRSPTSSEDAVGQENVPPFHPNIQPPSLTLKKAMAADVDNAARSTFVTATTQQDGSDADADAAAYTPAKVVVRIRPVNRREKEGVRIVQKLSSDALSIEERTYKFDSILGPESSQEDVFNLVGVPLVKDSLAGFNTTVLTYGQTGSGKTYTMWGPPSAMLDCHSINSYQGIVPRIFHMLFSEIQKVDTEEKKVNYQCRCSFVEIYNEQINDLLDPTHRNLQIRNDARDGFNVENLTDEYVTTIEDVTQILVKGLSNRKIGATSMNSKSSRSHIMFTCTIESWCKGSSSKCFSSSKTSRISIVDLAGWDEEKLDGVSRHIMQEAKYVKQSLSKLGKMVNVLAEIACSGKDQKIPYKDSCLTHLLQDTLGGNSKITFVCSISPNDRHRSGTLSTLRFGERAKLMRNKVVINEITEDHVNGLSDQIRQLKEDLLSAKAYGGDSKEIANAYFKRRNTRDSLNLLRVSLNRSLILPHIDNDSEEELDVNEDSIMELCSQLSSLTSSYKEKSVGIEGCKNTISILSSAVNSTVKVETSLDSHLDGLDEELSFSSFEEGKVDEAHFVVSDSEIPDTGTASQPLKETSPVGHYELDSAMSDLFQDSPRKSSCPVVPPLQLPFLQDPTVCLSPKINDNLKKRLVTSSNLSAIKDASESSLTISEKQDTRKCDPIRSSLKSSKICSTESLAVSLHRGLQILDQHHQSSAAKRSLLGLSFEHLSSVSYGSIDNVNISSQALPEDVNRASLLCSACRNVLDADRSAKVDSESLANAEKSKIELETLSTEQAAMTRQLNCQVDQYKDERKQTSIEAEGQLATSHITVPTDHGMPIKDLESEDNLPLTVEQEEKEFKNKRHDTPIFRMSEREALLKEIQHLKDQLKSSKSSTNVITDDSLLQQIRSGIPSSDEYEQERQRWTESESRWISLTEELRLDLESYRKLAEKKDSELNMEKKCTAELDDALKRSILGHARIIEHYAELQEKHNDLLGRHRKVMEGIAEVKKAASKAGSKGASKAFAAALAAEVSTLRVERERERAFLKEQNKGLKIQLRDTAEAVHAAGELLVRLREAEEAVSLIENKYGQAQQENERLRKQIEKLKKKHTMEMETMKHYLAESRLPESALEPLFRHGSGTADEPRDQFPEDEQSWRAEFGPSYQ